MLSTPFVFPNLGESVHEGTITRWLKSVGDAVTEGEPLVEVATDKVDSEIVSPSTGVLASIHVPEGQTAVVGEALASIEGVEDAPEPNRTESKPPKQSQGDEMATMPDRAESRDARFARGEAVLRSIGDDDVNGVVGSLADVSPELAHQVVAWGFGDIYGRPGLVPRDRQLVTLGILTALGGAEPQLKIHITTALNVGLTREEIVEALLHASIYCGMPRAINATLIAKQVFVERERMPAPRPTD